MSNWQACWRGCGQGCYPIELHSSNGVHSIHNALHPSYTLLINEQLAGVVAGVWSGLVLFSLMALLFTPPRLVISTTLYSRPTLY